MPPEEEKKETPGPGGAPVLNGAPIVEDLSIIKAELDEERKAKAAIETALAERDKRITELQATVSVVTQAGDTATQELATTKKAHSQAVSKYLQAARALNPAIPQDVIAGQTIEEIDASLAKALSIATAVRASLEAQAKEGRVPAGAPTRGEISLEALSSREKIAAGIQQKGGQ